MTIHEYLSQFSPNRGVDSVFVQWYTQKYTAGFVKKSKAEWDAVYASFSGETEDDRLKDKNPEPKAIPTPKGVSSPKPALAPAIAQPETGGK